MSNQNYIKPLFFWFLFILIFGLTRCDIIQKPYTKPVSISVCDSIWQNLSGRPYVRDTIQRVMVEDFTGFTCGKCPEASRELKKIQAQYGERLVVVKPHVTETFAAPLPAYPTDFRTPVGNELEKAFNLVGIPIGTVNRQKFGGEMLLPFTLWARQVGRQLNQKSQAYIDIEPVVNQATNELTVKVFSEMPSAITPNHYLAIYLVQDSIIGFQKDYNNANLGLPVNIENYVHMDMLRGAINGTWGLALTSSPLPANSVIRRCFTQRLRRSPDRAMDMNPKYLSVVAFIHDNTTKSILNVIRKPVIIR